MKILSRALRINEILSKLLYNCHFKLIINNLNMVESTLKVNKLATPTFSQEIETTLCKSYHKLTGLIYLDNKNALPTLNL